MWNVEIRPIYFYQKNEDWNTVPTIIINYIPEEIRNQAERPLTKDDPLEIPKEDFPEGYNENDFEVDFDITDINNPSDDFMIQGGWTERKETRIRDKYCKIKVRYSGEDLAIITALKTIYTVSYS